LFVLIPKAGVEQVGDRARLAGGVVLEVHERDVIQVVQVIVELVAADREIRELRLRQAAAVGDLGRRRGIADVVALANEHRIFDA
jgi:hypothetical protein